MFRRIAAVAAVCSTVVCSTAGCGSQGRVDEACLQDRLRCGDGPELATVAACEPEPTLDATLGLGQDVFLRLLPRQEPPLTEPKHGDPFMVLGIRVDGVNAVQRMVQLDVTVLEYDDSAQRYVELAQRTVVYDDEMLEGEDTRAEAIGLVVIPSRWGRHRPRRIVVDVETACGGETRVQHELARDE